MSSEHALEPHYMRLQPSAHYMGFEERTMRTLVAKRELPFYKVAGRLLFDRRDLDAYLEAHRVEASA